MTVVASTVTGQFICFHVFLKCSKVSYIIYTRLYNYFWENTILYSKQFGFQTGPSTDHAIIPLVDQIYENFEENKYILGMFIDLAKTFDTTEHKIVLRKMEIYVKGGITLKWFENYLTNRKQ